MTATPAAQRVRRLRAADVADLVARLEAGFGATPSLEAMLSNQFLLDALDRGQHPHFVVWPGEEPTAVLYAGSGGTLVPAGAPAAAPALALASERISWRVLVGDAAIAEPLLERAARGLFRRRVSAREQRFMIAGEPAFAVDAPSGLRPARSCDLDRLTAFACNLHVEDRMGPPIARSGRAAIRSRMAASVERGAAWVVERRGQVVAKIDLSLHSPTRGAQIAGVYVDAEWRGAGIATGAVGAITALLLDRGLPGVTLHVRADNGPGVAAYGRAGFTDHGAWTLALR
ncbi:MAG: GNAT family N-acetyltransferase [Euzebyales bacterium]|nr:GNAT family N-acetyltransferase [Euzebyales bacterium]